MAQSRIISRRSQIIFHTILNGLLAMASILAHYFVHVLPTSPFHSSAPLTSVWISIFIGISDIILFTFISINISLLRIGIFSNITFGVIGLIFMGIYATPPEFPLYEIFVLYLFVFVDIVNSILAYQIILRKFNLEKSILIQRTKPNNKGKCPEGFTKKGKFCENQIK